MKGEKKTILKQKILRVGRIPYANLFPIFYYLDKECDNSAYRFIKGAPSRLNRMLNDGDLDISISSSIEYLKNKDRYLLLPSFSISSYGSIESILVFSKVPLEELGSKTVAMTSESDTSVALLKIILKEFIGIKCRFKTVRHRTVKGALSKFPALLLIGDSAMKEAKKTVTKRDHKPQTTKSSACHPLPITHSPSVYKYDLAELWHKYTGLPFVFALWIVRNETLSEKGELLKRLSSDLVRASRFTTGKLRHIAKESPLKEWLTEKELVNYWKKISYDFTEEHMKGLRLFEKYVKNL